MNGLNLLHLKMFRVLRFVWYYCKWRSLKFFLLHVLLLFNMFLILQNL